MECQVEARVPHSALSIYLQQLASGNVQGMHTPHTHSFIFFSKPHRASSSLENHAWSCGPCPESTLCLGDDCRTRWTHKEKLCCLKQFRDVFPQGTLEQVLKGWRGCVTLDRGRLVLWLPIGYAHPPLLWLTLPLASLPCNWRSVNTQFWPVTEQSARGFWEGIFFFW